MLFNALSSLAVGVDGFIVSFRTSHRYGVEFLLMSPYSVGKYIFIYGQMIANIRWSFRVIFFWWRLALTILNPIYFLRTCVFGLGPGIILQYF